MPLTLYGSIRTLCPTAGRQRYSNLPPHPIPGAFLSADVVVALHNAGHKYRKDERSINDLLHRQRCRRFRPRGRHPRLPLLPGQGRQRQLVLGC